MNTWSKSPELKWKTLLLNHLQLRIRTADAHLVALEEWKKSMSIFSLSAHFKKRSFQSFSTTLSVRASEKYILPLKAVRSMGRKCCPA